MTSSPSLVIRAIPSSAIALFKKQTPVRDSARALNVSKRQVQKWYQTLRGYYGASSVESRDRIEQNVQERHFAGSLSIEREMALGQCHVRRSIGQVNDPEGAALDWPQEWIETAEAIAMHPESVDEAALKQMVRRIPGGSWEYEGNRTR